ncbi:TetR/AcrR family transcriptional regulator C-terminal domain-containing protein [Actinoplanes sp. NPDC051851]|uniref:TetR/AcrR family transcriptional regulator C-terminal domain-containing protein n=1 Tax=Actinoplanes sp. NPDC051851 TaxID=3154753 RepID=UPI00343ADB52
MSADFLWAERPKRRGPKPALTVEAIADAATAIADAEGLAAVSMQRVAADLGFTKMSLYRYLPGRAELVAVMLERALGPAPEISGGSWRDALVTWSECLREAYIGHPWALEAVIGNRPIGPHEMGWMEAALARIPTTLTGSERMDTVAVLAGHVRAIAAQEATMGSESELTKSFAGHAAEFPAIMAALRDTTGADNAFHFGLERILDGLEHLVNGRV